MFELPDGAHLLDLLPTTPTGGCLIDGKVFSDGVRTNRKNPDARGRYFPLPEAPEWDQV